jgi:hypothetical protein
MHRVKSSLRFVVISLLVFLLLVGGPASGQSPQPGDEDYEPPPGVQADPGSVDENQPPPPVPFDSPDDANDRTGIAGELVIVDDVMQVQGRLTDGGGAPISGDVTIVASLYDVDVGGTARCTDTDSVPVNDGLFVMNLDSCTASDFNGDKLYLGIQVGADPEMTPRQQIYAVPYAWALRPGAIVKGADSYVFLPGSVLIKNASADSTRWDIQPNGAARVWRGATAGSKLIYLPIILPSVLYGQNVTLEQVTVYYRCGSASNGFITRTVLNVQTGADSFLNIVDNATDRTSTTAATYSISPSANNVFSSTQGALSMYLNLSFANDTDYVDIGGVRLRLGHQ